MKMSGSIKSKADISKYTTFLCRKRKWGKAGRVFDFINRVQEGIGSGKVLDQRNYENV